MDPHIRAAASYYQMAAGYFERADQTLSQLPSLQPDQASRARLGLWMGKGKLLFEELDTR